MRSLLLNDLLHDLLTPRKIYTQRRWQRSQWLEMRSALARRAAL